METIMVLGAGGLLGTAVAAACPGRVVTAGRTRLQDRSDDEIARLIGEAAPSVVINCAANVDADGAERDPATALAANAVLPGQVAAACRAQGALMVQFSSTGCYGAWKDEPFTEDDPVRPTTAHHRSKVEGEAAVRASGAEHLIARVGWLYGGGTDNPRNFVWRRVLEASATAQLASDTDQRGCPSDVVDVARQLLLAVRRGARGTVNMVTRGSASRFDYVSRIVAASGLTCEVVPRPAFHRAAPVSHNEAALNTRLDALGIDVMPDWGEALDDYVERLRSGPHWLDRRS